MTRGQPVSDRSLLAGVPDRVIFAYPVSAGALGVGQLARPGGRLPRVLLV